MQTCDGRDCWRCCWQARGKHWERQHRRDYVRREHCKQQVRGQHAWRPHGQRLLALALQIVFFCLPLLFILPSGLRLALLPGLELVCRAEVAVTASLAVIASGGPPEPGAWATVTGAVPFGAL